MLCHGLAATFPTADVVTLDRIFHSLVTIMMTAVDSRRGPELGSILLCDLFLLFHLYLKGGAGDLLLLPITY